MEALDPSQAFDAEMLSRQKPMNDVIDRGDSAVQQYYDGASIFVTGGSGFLGKQLIEKLFRACNIKKMFILMRPKKGKSMQERLDYMLRDSVFDPVRSKKPRFADSIVPVMGDVADVRLGLSDEDWAKITAQVDMVIHMAATIRFDEPLRVATLTNVRGTRETVALAKECAKLRNFVYVSTAYTHASVERVGKEVREDFYPAPLPPHVIIGMAEEMDQDRLNGITPGLIKGWPNTYTFTKAIAEEVVRASATELPVCVVRPPIVVSSYLEPLPGWCDMSCVLGPTGIVVGVALGVLHVFFVDVDNRLALVPVDYVNNAIIAAGWDAADRRARGDPNTPVYTVARKECFMPWSFAGYVMRTKCSQEFMTPKAVWYCSLIETKNKLLYWILTWLLHYIPAYILDGVCAVLPIKPKEIPSFVKIYSKIDKMSYVYRYFLTNSWDFKDDNVRNMIEKMSDVDKVIFNCDLSTICFLDFIRSWTIGLKKYIIKDGLKDREAKEV
ncbi:hypothetical protein PYW08_010886 [Mythimna loreyi]|uniref:Uncharacterized protein n=1 Tax=Mythimna loreyi TaxID=667449 RepID=A0ACC2Q2K5_9NEOP|nr:hypothetical protein PYW08_010886 [Mythimna loreyi]